ncbi:hypothetical protein [Actinomycetospora sp. TBRC 11914]|nr:hypothetical protein [Actinomycetospora sp. TBRC 11914]
MIVGTVLAGSLATGALGVAAASQSHDLRADACDGTTPTATYCMG